MTGAALRGALTELVDRHLAALLDAAVGDQTSVALVALGGYGRREPAPASDLDLVLVHRGDRDIVRAADRLWYPLWDTGLTLDHSVKTVAQAVSVAADDLK